MNTTALCSLSVSLLMLCSVTSAMSVSLNEFMPDPIDTCMDCTEWIELEINQTPVNLTIDAGGENSTFTVHFPGIVVITENSSIFSESWIVDPSNLLTGKMSLNNGGDCLYVYNETSLLDQACYNSAKSNVSFSWCGTWKETENATPGNVNGCTSDAIDNSSGNETSNETEVLDYSGISVDVNGPEESVRFGDFSQVTAIINTGGKSVPIRIVTYIYSPRWVTVDLEGNTIRSYLNDTQTALEMEMSESGETILHLPLFVKNSCDGEYSDGVYTGRVRIYENMTSDIVAEDTFEITLQGNNDLFCCSCPECDECEETSCNCGSSVMSNVHDEDGGNGVVEILHLEESVQAGVPFETKVVLRNPGSEERSFSVYSYAYEGSMCVSMGPDDGEWKRTWTANSQTFDIPQSGSKEVTLTNMFDDETEAGAYTFRIRAKVDGSKNDVTRRIKVTPVQKGKGLPNTVEETSWEDVTVEIVEDGDDTSEQATGMVTAAGMENAPDVFSAFVSWLSSIFGF